MSKKFIILISAALIVAIAACAVLLVILLNPGETPTPPNGGGVVYDPNQGDDQTPGGQKPANTGVVIAGFGNWTIPPNVTDVAIDLHNPEANAEKFDMTFEIRVVNDSEQGYEVVYKSGLVEAGKHIQKITLSHGFEKGEYEAYLFVQPYKVESQTTTNNANLKFKLIVK